MTHPAARPRARRSTSGYFGGAGNGQGPLFVATLNSMQTLTVSSYGAGMTTAAQAVAVLRARAATQGVPLLEAPPAAQRVAVVAAEVFAAAVGARCLDAPVSSAQQAAAAAILTRAAGQSSSTRDPHSVGGGRTLGSDDLVNVLARELAVAPLALLPQSGLAHIFRVTAWARRQGASPAELGLAVHDLSVGWLEPRIAAGCDALLTAAVELD